MLNERLCSRRISKRTEWMWEIARKIKNRVQRTQKSIGNIRNSKARV
jgi:hypothetical protein